MTTRQVQLVTDISETGRRLVASATGGRAGIIPLTGADGTIAPEFTADSASKHGADVASATTIDLDAATGDIVDVTGTTTITGITLTEGDVRFVRFTGALTLTHGASLILPGAVSITTVAGDWAVFIGYASGVVYCASYSQYTVTGTGPNVLKNSPALVTPDLGTPSALVGTNITSTPVGALLVPKWGSITQTVLKSAFTDGGGTSGTLVMSGTVPAGAVLIGSKLIVNVGFSGDTSAVLTIGDGSDVDRYNTGTPNIFTTAATGIETGVPSGNKLVTTANTPTLTVTSAADFTNVAGTGSITVTIYYLQTV